MPKKHILVEPAIVLFIIILNAFGIHLGTILTPGRVMVSFIAILILEMIPFADAKYRLKVVLLLSMIVCTFIAFKVKDKTVIQTDLVDIWVYGLIGLLGGIYTSNLRMHLT